MRVHAENHVALRCYAATGFRRVTPEDEATFNEGQPQAYVWLQLDLTPNDRRNRRGPRDVGP